jgi:hypothetical protein
MHEPDARINVIMLSFFSREGAKTQSLKIDFFATLRLCESYFFYEKLNFSFSPDGSDILFLASLARKRFSGQRD